MKLGSKVHINIRINLAACILAVAKLIEVLMT
jgi:hypothetical protein